MNRTKILLGWTAAFGAMDACTGLLLVAAPAATLGLLGITPPEPNALVFVSWIGVFVGAVGLSYGLALINRRWGATVWAFTTLVRALVGVFVCCQIASGELALQWGLVAVADLAVAAFQFALLRARWWEEVRQ